MDGYANGGDIMKLWRQWYIHGKAIPPEMNSRFNNCHACTHIFDREYDSSDPDTNIHCCSIHRDELSKYAATIPEPTKYAKGGVRTEWTINTGEYN
jgi:hypothetical protein